MTECANPFENGGGLCEICRHAPESGGPRRCSKMIGKSPAMHALLVKAATVAGTDASIVLRGPSGSGKEVVARAIHANSARAEKGFVAINCAALPGDLLESELFGHAKGAFTGAHVTRRGLFEAANGGTLFLDEIAEMPPGLQAKLLRALQDGEIRRVGETEPFSVDVRVICATHQDLTLAVQERRFREDLYFRLKVFTLVVPALKERAEDIVPLAELFLMQEHHPTRRFTRAALDALLRYSWPGNVRELRNAVKHGAVLSRQVDVDVAHLPEELTAVKGPAPVSRPSVVDEGELVPLVEAERRHIARVLEACGGHQTEAARLLGIGRTTLWRKLKEHGLPT